MENKKVDEDIAPALPPNYDWYLAAKRSEPYLIDDDMPSAKQALEAIADYERRYAIKRDHQ
jgi:hypothetical protein